MFPFRGIASLIGDLASIPHSVAVTLVYPDYLAEHPGIEPPSLLEDRVAVAQTAAGIPPFTLSRALPGRWRKPLENRAATATLGLLALAEAVQADGIITDSELLVGGRYPLYQHHRVRIIPLAEFGDVLESCAHGHGIFWSATEPSRNYTQDIYYQTLHPNGRKLARWFYPRQSRVGSR
jgi:hypothetical protein